jgi:predicted metalloprotease with PDZ domain
VLRGTPAYGSALAAGDELIALDGFRFGADGLDAALEQYQPGAKVELLASRRGELRRVAVTLGRAPADRWSLSVRPDATPEQQRRLTAWLGGPRGSSKGGAQ